MSTNNEALLTRRRNAVPRGPFHVTDIVAVRAKGAMLWDADGKSYIDFAGGIGCVNAGHCPDEVVAAIRDQAERYIHPGFHVAAYEPYVALAEELNQLVPGCGPQKTLLVNSGAEAVENAVKIARCASGRPAVVAFENAFHGRTLLGMTLTSKVKPYKFSLGTEAPCVHRIAHPSSHHLQGIDAFTVWDEFFATRVAAEDLAAVIIEPVQGEGGFHPCPIDYMRRLRALCDKHGIILIADEVQTGFCRTGRMFAMEHYGVAADLTVLGKSLASGMPLAAITGRTDLMDAVPVGGIGGTFGGNPLACRAALATIAIYRSRRLAERAEAIGKQVRAFFMESAKEHPFIGEPRGLGAMIGVPFRDHGGMSGGERLANLQRAARAGGLVLMSAGTRSDVLRTLMPLVISDDELRSAFKIISECLAGVGAAA